MGDNVEEKFDNDACESEDGSDGRAESSKMMEDNVVIITFAFAQGNLGPVVVP